MLNYMNAHLAYVSWFTVTLVFLARLFTKSGPPAIVELLPPAFDVTTWSKHGWIGTIGQLLVNVVIAGGGALLILMKDGLSEEDFVKAGNIVLETLGLYHGIKLAIPAVAKRKAALKAATKAVTTTLSATVALLLALGCTPLSSSQIVHTALDQTQAVCQNTLLRSDTPKMLINSGVLPDLVGDVIEATCAALPVAEIIASADKQRAPRARALQAAARERGLLP
jgi:hypothetical protein